MLAAAPASALRRLRSFGVRRVVVLAALVLSQVFLVVIPSQAHAATETWAASEVTCGTVPEERGSGQMDATGKLYIPCVTSNRPSVRPCTVTYSDGRTSPVVCENDFSIHIFDQAGNDTGVKVPLPWKASDVAPSADGAYLYVVHYYGDKTAYRFNRQPNGGYVLDPTWRLDPFTMGGVAYTPRGEFIQTDAQGGIYFSAGLWSNGTPTRIVKYTDAGTHGVVVGQFGQQGSATSWAFGDFQNSGGMAVTADGSRVFVADILNSRIQRFDRDATGAYIAQPVVIGRYNTTDRSGYCGVISAPYDVSLTPAGELVVINTSCYINQTVEIFRYAQDGTPRGIVEAAGLGEHRVHGIAVARSGRIMTIEGGITITRPAGSPDTGAAAGAAVPGPMGGTAAPGDYTPPVAVPAPDMLAPTFQSIQASVTRGSKVVTMNIAATDDRAITGIRVTEDGVVGAWQPYRSAFTYAVATFGAHTLVLVLNDAAGNVSGTYTVRATINDNAPSPTPVPTPTPTPTKPVVPPVTGGGTTKPTPKPTPTGPNVVADTTAPTITAVKLPGQITGGRKVSVTLKAFDNVAGGIQVRFATENGRWGAWQTLTGRKALKLSAGRGWKGVFTQVRDAAGNRSKPWFQTIFVAPLGSSWVRGTSAADSIRGNARANYIDASQYDGKVDTVTCGAGADYVLLQPGDTAARDCEHVMRLVTPKF